MAGPGNPSILLYILELLSAADGLRLGVLRQGARKLFAADNDGVAPSELERWHAFEASFSWALFHLKASGLITSPVRGIYAISALGRALLEQSPAGLSVRKTMGAARRWQYQVLAVAAPSPIPPVKKSAKKPVSRSAAKASPKTALPDALLLKAVSPMDTRAEDRFVQCSIVKSGPRSRPVKRLVARQNYLARIHIGSEVDEGTLRADMAFDETQLPPSEAGHDLQVVFCPLDTSATPDRILPGQVQTLHLPQVGRSGVVVFSFTTQASAKTFRARVLVMHHNRVLQTLMLSAPEAGAELALRQENTVSPVFTSSVCEVAADLAIVVNDSPAGAPGITTVTKDAASFSEPEGLAMLVKTIESLLSDTNVSTAGEALQLAHPKLVALLVQLATQGFALKRELSRQINLADFAQAARIQVVEARAKAYLPVEFVYTGKPPNINAKLCPNAKKALLDPGACTTTTCKYASNAKYVCPAAFWGFSKCIERQPFGKSDQHVFQIPQPGADSLSPFKAAVLAASARVAETDLTGPDGLLSALTALTPKVRLAKSWAAWQKDILAKPAATLLVLLPHTDNSPDFLNTPALEIQKKWLTSVQLNEDFVQAPTQTGPGPVVLLLGCSTALADVPFLNFVREFKEAGASIVLGTLATVHGTRATRFARTLLEKIKTKGTGRAFDEILLEVKREMLADGDPFVLSLAAYGNSAWRIQA